MPHKPERAELGSQPKSVPFFTVVFVKADKSYKGLQSSDKVPGRHGTRLAGAWPARHLCPVTKPTVPSAHPACVSHGDNGLTGNVNGHHVPAVPTPRPETRMLLPGGWVMGGTGRSSLPTLTKAVV